MMNVYDVQLRRVMRTYESRYIDVVCFVLSACAAGLAKTFFFFFWSFALVVLNKQKNQTMHAQL